MSPVFEGGYPRYLWTWIDGNLYEARHINGPQGTYKGYRLEDIETPSRSARQAEVGPAMKLEFEWQEAPGVRDRILAATWSRLSLTIGDVCISEAIDSRSNSRRTGIYGSLFPFAEWLVEQWWELLHEALPVSPVPGGRVARPAHRDWVQRHNLLAARDGGALPDLTIARDGDDIVLQWTPDPTTGTLSRLRFVGQGTARLNAQEFERVLVDFVQAVFARLDEGHFDNEDVRRLARAWEAIQSASPEERKLCESLAVMGVDPYDPDEATDELVSAVERSLREVPEELRRDLLEGSTAASFEANLAWIERERRSLEGVAGATRFPTISFDEPRTAHETGYRAARLVRSELLRMQSKAPVKDLKSVLVERLGWAPDLFKEASHAERQRGTVEIEGMVGLDTAKSAPLLVIPNTRSEPAERFRLARAAYFPVTWQLHGSARLLTGSSTRPQRAARAFAAELLAPAEALRECISGRVSEQQLEQLAAEFVFGQMVILHQLENHDIGYLES